jgi:hypothetical protein
VFRTSENAINAKLAEDLFHVADKYTVHAQVECRPVAPIAWGKSEPSNAIVHHQRLSLYTERECLAQGLVHPVGGVTAHTWHPIGVAVEAERLP